MLFCLHSFPNKNPIHEFPWLSNESPLLHVIFQFASLTNSGKLPQHAILIVTHLKPVAISRHFSFYRQKWNKNNSMICAGYHVWNNLPPFCWFCLHYTIVYAKWCEVGCRLWIEWAQRGRGSDFTQSALILPHEQMVGNKTLIIM